MEQLQQLINDESAWWNKLDALMEQRSAMQTFMKNMQHNFSEHAPVYQLLENTQHTQQRLDDIAHALMNFNVDRKNWQAALL